MTALALHHYADPVTGLRPPDLWRAVCFVAEHTFVDELWPHAGAHWNVPRPLVRAVQGRLAERWGSWQALSDAFVACADERTRFGVLLDGLTKTGNFLLLSTTQRSGISDLARAAGISFGAAHRSMRLLARHCLVGPAFLRAAMVTFRLSPTRITTAPFIPVRHRRRVEASEDDVEAFRSAFARQPSEAPNAAPLALTQLSALLQDPWVIVRSIPAELLYSEERLRASSYGSVVDLMIARAERQCGEIERLLAHSADGGPVADTVAVQVSDRLASIGPHSALRNLAHLLDWRGAYSARAHGVAQRLAALADAAATGFQSAYHPPHPQLSRVLTGKVINHGAWEGR